MSQKAKLNKYCLGLLFMLLSVTFAYAQKVTVSGTVLDETGEAVIGANVVEKGTTNGIVTDMDGKFSLSVNSLSTAVLQISYVGYNTVETAVKGRQTVDVSLEPSVVDLGEVVAVGYGTQTRRQITGSVANVSEEDFNKGLTRDAADLLQGKVAGLMIGSGTGDVTSQAKIQMRGVTTLQNDEGPLIVIDGVPGGDLSTVSPNDIEQISVLKDATSAAIYGSRAAGGVILITTKRGRGGRTSVNYDGYLSFDVIAKKPSLMDANQWRNYAKQYAQEQNPETYDQYNADTDWYDEITRTGISQNHSVSISGGTSSSNYRASYTYQDRNGIMRDNSQERHSFRFQMQQRAINDRLRIGLTGSGTILNREMTDRDNIVYAYSMIPVYPVYNSDGTYFTKVNAEYDQGNPVQNQDLNSNETENNMFYGQGDIQFTIIDGLNIKTNLFKSRFSRTASRYYNSQTAGSGMDNNGYANKFNQVRDRNLMEWTLDYDKKFGDHGQHAIQGLLGYSWEDFTFSYFYAQNRNFLTNDLSYNSLQSGNGIKTGDTSSGKNAYTLISMYGRLFYGYDNRYMITAMLRRDGSSKFGKNNKWGLFPSVSAAWGIKNEGFMKDNDLFDELKLRIGYGVTGNQTGLNPYTTLELYSMSGIYYDNGTWSTAYAISQNPNPDLKWESTATTNIGLDFSMFKGRVGGTIELYNKKTFDMLYSYTVPTPPYVYSTMMANVGDMVNKGIEAVLNVGIIRNKDFQWNTSINVAYNHNEITKLSNDLYSTERVYTGSPWIRGGSGVTSHVVEEGRPVGQFYMLHCDGISDEGKFIFADLNNDGNIDDADRTYCGSALPDFTFGWQNSFNYKNLDLSIFLRGMTGNKVFNNPRCAYANNTYLIGTNALEDELTYKLKGQNSQISDYYIEDASFVRLDNMSLGYTFNTKHISWLEKVRIYVAGQNLFCITGYKGIDPEVEMSGTDLTSATDRASSHSGIAGGSGLYPGIEWRTAIPRSRTFTIGVNLVF